MNGCQLNYAGSGRVALVDSRSRIIFAKKIGYKVHRRVEVVHDNAIKTVTYEGIST